MTREVEYWRAHLAGLQPLGLLDKDGLEEFEEVLSESLENGGYINTLALYYDLVCDHKMDRVTAMVVAGLTPYELALAEAGYDPYRQQEVEEYHRIQSMSRKQVRQELKQLTGKL